MPTYNRAPLIAEAIQSVMAQSYLDWELIVVDDGSTDDTRQVVAQFADRVRYLYQPNAGVCAARNRGFEAARGEYISFLDSDDLMLPHNLAALAAVLEARPEVGVAYGWYYWMDPSGQPVASDDQLDGQTVDPADMPWPGLPWAPSGTLLEGQIFSELVLEETMLLGTSLIRRACIEAIGGFALELKYQEHWDFYLRLARAGCVYACCRRPVIRLRLHLGNRGRDLDRMLAGRLQVLERAFAGADDSGAKVRAKAYFRTYLEFCRIYYAAHRFAEGGDCLRRAWLLQGLGPRDRAQLAQILSDLALSAESADPFTELRQWSADWPSTDEARRLRTQVWAGVHSGLAFRQYQAHDYPRAWRSAFAAVWKRPEMARNRGLVRVGIESLLGPRVFGWLRRQGRRRADQPSGVK